MKKRFSLLALGLLLLVTGCSGNSMFSSSTGKPFSTPQASGHYSPEIVQCAIYAREVTGVGLYGSADSWWHSAGQLYLHGTEPREGSILVLKKTSRMSGGHVAVVKAIKGSRLISVTHSNWGSDSKTRHIIFDSMSVEDVSKHNDWSSVRFWNYDKKVYGFPYAAYGFIYP